MAKRLTALKVDKITTKGRYPDGDGLFLQVGLTGAKSWLLRYQLSGRERYMGLGSVRNFTLKEARERARKARQLLDDGIDPIEHRLSQRDLDTKQARERITFKDATEQFLSIHERGWKNAKHRAQWRSSLKVHAFPILGERPVSAIDQALINNAVAPIWTTTPETAKRVRDRIERICQWVKDGMPLPTRVNGNGGKRHHPALAWWDMPKFVAELRQRKSVSARALEFLILTAARTGEVIGATWNEIDLEKRLWVVRAERMKATREHGVPLSAAAVELLKALPREKGNGYVFIGAQDGRGLSNMAMMQILRDLRPGMTVHGFRATFKTWCDESQHVENAVVEAALAHVTGDKVEAAYRRGDMLAKRAKLMTDWSAFCSSKPAKFYSFNEKRAANA